MNIFSKSLESPLTVEQAPSSRHVVREAPGGQEDAGKRHNAAEHHRSAAVSTAGRAPASPPVAALADEPSIETTSPDVPTTTAVRRPPLRA